ncbi:hypothetical protein AUJ44_01570 [Candidatus Nomurabacteria bacterium CG1_02_47_685]|nr:MAG: hypothetical protein AUJ44_01570 [Candidatus Nomurabacteria bacterium CG1_02_47_685]
MNGTFLGYVILGIVIGAICAAFLVFYFGRRRESGNGNNLLLLQNQMNELSKVIDTRLSESRKDMREAVQTQFSESQKLVRNINEQVTKQLVEVTKGVTEANEASKQVFSIAEGLQNLEKVLKHQKQRGNLGEASLKLSLGNILSPDDYQTQYLFENGDQVDAVIKTKEGLIPIDAKFSLDNYNRIVNESDEDRKTALEKEFRNDLKKRIDETAKYIRPKEGTLPFAFMFIPAEGIYYDLLVNEIGAVKVNTRSLIDYAYREKKVIIASPTTFVAYLHAVAHALNAFKFEKNLEGIRTNVDKLMRHLKAYDEYFKKVGKSLGTTVGHYNLASKELGKVDKDILHITGDAIGMEAELLERPSGSDE